MEAYLLDWLTLIARWAHIVVGIAWIGASFYFIWLDNHLEAAKDPAFAGELYAIHGGGFYRAQKYRLAPDALPTTLHWFKWEAYWTWLTGFVLLVLVYYLNADLYLIDPQVMKLSPAAAIGVGLGSLVLGLVVYEGLCRAPLGERGLTLALLIVFGSAAWALTQIFSGRGAFIHFGAILGTIMAANVAHVIIPGQRELVRAKEQNREADPEVRSVRKTAQRPQHVLHAAGDLHHDLRASRHDVRRALELAGADRHGARGCAHPALVRGTAQGQRAGVDAGHGAGVGGRPWLQFSRPGIPRDPRCRSPKPSRSSIAAASAATRTSPHSRAWPKRRRE